jgi:hypothetical protein
MDIDGLFVTDFNAQLFSDSLNDPFAQGNLPNISSGSITDQGGLARKLTLNVSIQFNIDIEDIDDVGITLSSMATGTIVAYATIPEPSTLVLAGAGAAALGVAGWRRRTRSKASNGTDS